jgi:hypothetical protein
MIPVEIISPKTPDVKLPIKIDKAELTVTFPNKIVHKRRFPFLRIGKIFFAYSASFASYSSLNGPFVNNSKSFTSRLNNPKFNPEKAPDIVAKQIIIMKSVQTGGIYSGSLQRIRGSSVKTVLLSSLIRLKERNLVLKI